MLKTTKLLTITVPKSTYSAIRHEAKKRRDTVSGMLRKAFVQYIENDTELYSDQTLRQLLKDDRLSKNVQRDLDRLLRKS